MKKNKQASFNVIECFCALSEALEHNGQVYFDILKDAEKHPIRTTDPNPYTLYDSIHGEKLAGLPQLSEYLHLTPRQTLVFVAVYSKQLLRGNQIDIDDITDFLDFNAVQFLPFRKHVDELVEKGMLERMTFRRGELYHVCEELEETMRNNLCFNTIKKKKIDQYEFCQRVSNLIESRTNDEFGTSKLFQLVDDMEHDYAKLPIVRQLQKFNLSIEERTFYYEVCDDFIRDQNHKTSISCTLTDIYSNTTRRLSVLREFMNEQHALLLVGLLELYPANFTTEAEIGLSDKGKQIFLGKDMDLFIRDKKGSKSLIMADNIKEKKLFFDEKLSKKLKLLEDSLQEEQLKSLQQRLENNALPKGVTVLFHGLPGTGKTEAVMQLAKSTGRSVFHVDIAACKSMWFGESEKIMKRLFNAYREMCKKEPKIPILLFNEADALFSRRRDVESSSVAQTENAIQNILLEEVENLDGILIATTNLIKNFDDAFARRFLFKLRFDKPTKEAKKAIWKDKLPWLSDEEAALLAERHDLSGGEIDNVVRKSLMEEVINGQRPDVELLSQWCSDEKFGNGKSQPIGFTA